jgi:hypothetical protein
LPQSAKAIALADQPVDEIGGRVGFAGGTSLR